MKLRNLAACTFIILAGCASTGTDGASGAYVLMVPPLNQAGFAATNEPLSKWHNLGSFGTRVDCTSTMETQQNTAIGWYGRITNAQDYNQTQAVEILSGRCISIDDPGLKAK